MGHALSDTLQVTTALSRRFVVPGDDGSEPLGALLSIRAGAVSNPARALDLCLVLDASGSMHRFHLDAEQRELWRRIAEQRGDVVCDHADGQEGWLWSGQTLREMRGLIQTPMMAVIRALTATAQRLGPDDRLTIVAFADDADVLLNRAGASEREQSLATAVERLARGVDESGLGRGSRLAAALALARRVTPKDPTRPCRILIVSDGVVEDRIACLREVEATADEGTHVSTIGVGDEFDEELLMRMADDACGRYTYAPTAGDVEAALGAEVDIVARLAARGLWITVEPHPDVMFRELFRVAPAVSRFDTLWMEEAGFRYRLGDLIEGETVQLLGHFSLPPAIAGVNPVATVHVTTENGEAVVPLEVMGTEESEKVWERDPAVIAAMEAVEAYLGERRAQQAAARADVGEATRHLRHTTRILRRMGQNALAANFEALAADLEAGRTITLNRTKELKAATRRLGPAAPPAAIPAPVPAPRDLVHDWGR